MYFQQFPRTYYSLDDNASINSVTDITRRVNIIEQIRKNLSYFDMYDIIDGETPEVVADKFYGDPQLYWVILMANDILDPRFEWALSYLNLNNYCAKKYGVANVYNIHHYEDAFGYVTYSSAAGATAVTNYDYEATLNENRRRIKIPKAEIVYEIQNTFAQLINK